MSCESSVSSNRNRSILHAGSGRPESCLDDLPRLLGEACMVCHFRHHQSCWVVPTAQQLIVNITTDLLQDVMLHVLQDCVPQDYL